MNARLDYQQLEDEEHQQQISQALMNITAAGLRNEADLFAAECGMWTIWKQQFQPKGTRWQK